MQNTPSIVHQYLVTIYTTRNTQTSTLTVTLLKKIERIRIVTAITHSSSQRSLSLFWFQLLTIFSSFTGRDFHHSQATPCVPHCENQHHYGHTDYQLHKSCDSQTWYTFFCSNSSRFYTYAPDILIRNCVYEVHGLWMSWQFSLFFFEFAEQPIIIKTLSVILVWAYCEQGVHLQV